MVSVVVVEIKDQNEDTGAALPTPMNGTPITWISDPQNSNSMQRMDKQTCSGLAYSGLSRDENDDAEEDPNTTPSR
jgi:hypothetical protein